MRAQEKIMWKAVRAQGKHENSCDQLWDWENAESMRVDSEQAISASCYADSVMFLMKHARRSQKRLRLFKQLAIECRMYQQDCRNQVETQNPTSKQRAKLEQGMREAASNQSFLEEWVENETSYFAYIDELLSDVFERFTSLYTREDPTAGALFEFIDEAGEDVASPANLTRH